MICCFVGKKIYIAKFAIFLSKGTGKLLRYEKEKKRISQVNNLSTRTAHINCADNQKISKGDNF